MSRIPLRDVFAQFEKQIPIFVKHADVLRQFSDVAGRVHQGVFHMFCRLHPPHRKRAKHTTSARLIGHQRAASSRLGRTSTSLCRIRIRQVVAMPHDFHRDARVAWKAIRVSGNKSPAIRNMPSGWRRLQPRVERIMKPFRGAHPPANRKVNPPFACVTWTLDDTVFRQSRIDALPVSGPGIHGL